MFVELTQHPVSEILYQKPSGPFPFLSPSSSVKTKHSEQFSMRVGKAVHSPAQFPRALSVPLQPAQQLCFSSQRTLGSYILDERNAIHITRVSTPADQSLLTTVTVECTNVVIKTLPCWNFCKELPFSSLWKSRGAYAGVLQ